MSSECSPDETDATRSVLVSGLPSSTRKELLIIHFQKRKHGGGEVDSVKLLRNETFVVKFEDFEVAQSVLKGQHEIDGTPVDVKPYHKEPREVFSQVTASLLLHGLDVDADYMKEILENICTTTTIKLRILSDRFLVSGTFEHVGLARDLIRQKLGGNRGSQKMDGNLSTRRNSDQGSTLSPTARSRLRADRQGTAKDLSESVDKGNSSTEQKQTKLQGNPEQPDTNHNYIGRPPNGDETLEMACDGVQPCSLRQAITFDNNPKEVTQLSENVDRECSSLFGQGGNRCSQKMDGNLGTRRNSEQGIMPSPTAGSHLRTDRPKDSNTHAEPEKPDIGTFKVAPQIMQLISRTHRDKLKPMSRFVSMKQSEDKMSVTIKPKDNCDTTTFKKFCKSFDDLYNRVFSQTTLETVGLVGRSEESRSKLENVALSKMMQKYRVWIEMDEDNTVLRIYGVDSNVQDAKKMITRLLDQDTEGEREQSKSLEESSEVCKAENSNESQPNGKRKSIEHTTVTGIGITLCKGDITVESVDVIVNGVQAQPRREVIVAKDALSGEGTGRATDDQLSSESALSMDLAPQRGPCKFVINAPIPEWTKEEEQQVKKRLSKIVKECTVLASGHRMKSIAFPSFTSKPFQLPPDVSAIVQFRAIKTWSKHVGPMNHGLRDVRFVVPDDSSFEQFKSEFLKFFPEVQYKHVQPITERIENGSERAVVLPKIPSNALESIEERKYLDSARVDQVLGLKQQVPSGACARTSPTERIQQTTGSLTRIKEDYDQHTQESSQAGSGVSPNWKNPNQLQNQTAMKQRGPKYSGEASKGNNPNYDEDDCINVPKENEAVRLSSSQQERNGKDAVKPLTGEETHTAKELSKFVEKGNSSKKPKQTKVQGNPEQPDTNHNHIGRPPKGNETLEMACDGVQPCSLRQAITFDSNPSVRVPKEVTQLSPCSTVNRECSSLFGQGGNRGIQKMDGNLGTRRNSEQGIMPSPTAGPHLRTDRPKDSNTHAEPEKPDIGTFKVAPQIMQLISRTHRDKLKPMSRFVSMKQSEDKMSVTIKPKDNCDTTTFKKLCKSFGDLYNRVFSQTILETVGLVGRSEESRSKLESVALSKMMQKYRVWIEMDEDNTVLRIYGLDSNVQDAKKMITRLLDQDTEGERERSKCREESSEVCKAENSNERQRKGKRKCIEHNSYWINHHIMQGRYNFTLFCTAFVLFLFLFFVFPVFRDK